MLHALALNRAPGFHYPGFYLGMSWDHVDKQGVTTSIESGAHCTDADGRVNIAAIALLADIGLSTCVRPHIEPGARMATVNLHLHFTGVTALGNLTAHTRLEGFTGNTSVPLAYCRGTVCSAGKVVCYASGTFASPPAPPGVYLSPLPWQRKARGATPELATGMLDANERTVMRAATRSLSAMTQGGSFIEHFWGQRARAGDSQATNLVTLAPHMTNRVGHAQGGVLIGIAVATAMAALPHRTVLTSVSAWYLSPGQGSRLRAKARVIQRGRNVSVVRTEILASGGRRVLELISSHAAPPS